MREIQVVRPEKNGRTEVWVRYERCEECEEERGVGGEEQGEEWNP